MDEFAQNIKDLEVTTVSHARQVIEDKQTATFFIGRATCPYCRKFAKTLATVLQKTKAHIYFINSEELSELENLQHFRAQYGIPTVPGFLHTENGQVAVRCDSSMTPEDIITFAKL